MAFVRMMKRIHDPDGGCGFTISEGTHDDANQQIRFTAPIIERGDYFRASALLAFFTKALPKDTSPIV